MRDAKPLTEARKSSRRERRRASNEPERL
jgi:hypothetical protein